MEISDLGRKGILSGSKTCLSALRLTAQLISVFFYKKNKTHDILHHPSNIMFSINGDIRFYVFTNLLLCLKLIVYIKSHVFKILLANFNLEALLISDNL